MENIFNARYFIAITGMIMGNTIERNIIALDSFYKSLAKEKMKYNFALACGARKSEARLPFIRDSLKRSFNPQLARMSIMGIIALPGTMTGQILGGSSPQIAIKYQIVLMLMIFIAGMLTVVVTLNIANYMVFDKFGNLKTQRVFAGKQKNENGMVVDNTGNEKPLNETLKTKSNTTYSFFARIFPRSGNVGTA